MVRFQVPLTLEENRALFQLAQRERRPVRMQAALLIHQQLVALGALPDDTITGARITQEVRHEQPAAA